MTTHATPWTVAAVQAAPVFLDRDRTIDKACACIGEAARAGARVVAFPEAFVPAYPDWVWALPPGDERLLSDLYARYVEQSVTVPSEATDRLGAAARAAGAYVAIGVSERNAEASGTSLFNTLLYIGPDGTLLGKHRKLVPTAAERLVWAAGDGSTVGVYETPYGRLGGLICWENYMPLARFALYAWGVQLYVAATWDRSDVWLSTLRHIAREGRMTVLGCSTALRTTDLPEDLRERCYASSGEWINVGNSAIVGPDGEFLAGPVAEREEILYAQVDAHRLRAQRWMLDVGGHYARPDVFELRVRTDPQPMLLTTSATPSVLIESCPQYE